MTGKQFRDFVDKWILPAGAVTVLFAALFGGVQYIIKSEVAEMKGDVGGLKDSVGTLKGDIGKANDRIHGVMSKALERAFPSPTASKAVIRGSLKQANELIHIARTEAIAVSPQLIATYGKQVSALSDDPIVSSVAWQTLTNLLDYRSFLIGKNPPDTSAATPAPIPIGWRQSVYLTLAPKRSVQVMFGPSAPTPNAAVYEKIGENLNSGLRFGPAFVKYAGLGEGTSVSLDGFRLKNIVFQNVTVIYRDGPLAMENVYFVNCKFDVEKTATGQQFAQNILDHVPATFSRS